jgi:hypothetical protein
MITARSRIARPRGEGKVIDSNKALLAEEERIRDALFLQLQPSVCLLPELAHGLRRGWRTGGKMFELAESAGGDQLLKRR